MTKRDERKTKAELIAELQDVRRQLDRARAVSPSDATVSGTSLDDILRIRRAAYDAAPIGVFLAGSGGGYLYVNPTLARMYGFADPATLCANVTDIGTQIFADPSVRERMIAGLQADGQIMNFEAKVHHPNGDTVWTARSMRTVYADDGSFLFHEGFVIDITQRKQAEARYRSIFEKSALGIMHASIDGKLTDANPALASMLGYDSPDEMIDTISDITEQLYALRGSDAKVTGISPYDLDILCLETLFRRKDGSIITVEMHVRVLRDESGEGYIEGFVQDISERKRVEAALKEAHLELGRRVEERTRALRKSNITLRREIHDRILAEQKLRESEQKFKSISTSAQDAIIMIDHEGNISLWNRAAENLFGYKAKEVMGAPLHNVLAPPVARVAFEKGFKTFVRSGTGPAVNTLLEVEAMAKDGSTIPVELSISSVRYLDKWNAIGILRDISARKQTEEALRRAKDEAEAASRLKTDFLTVVSHELRTPLTSVVGFAKIIKKRLDTLIFPMVPDEDRKAARAVRQVAENIAVMVSEGERLTELINDVLDLAKLEAGKIDWKMESCSLPDLVEHSMAATQSLLRERGIRAATDIAPGIPEVVCDKSRILQVLINLISNAVKFTMEGSVTARLECTDDAVRISVTDTGIGIRETDRERIFDKFSQAGDTLTDRPRGTGLGLTICRQIVEHHGGEMDVQSTPGQGSTFSFTLPLPGGRTDEILARR